MSYSKLEIRNLDIRTFIPSATNTYGETTQCRIRNRWLRGPVLEVLEEGYKGTRCWKKVGNEPIYFSLVKRDIWDSTPPSIK